MALDLCIPAHNEAGVIQEAIRRTVLALADSGISDWHIVVVDNASNDGTAGAARAYQDARVSVVRIETKGKGAAILAAACERDSELFGFIDADLSADPADIARLAAFVSDGATDIAVGSRLLDQTSVHRSWLRTFPSICFNWLRKCLIGIRVHDSQCGLKVMNATGRRVLASCTETGWFLDLEFLARAERTGLSIREVPIHWEEERFAGRRSQLGFSDNFRAIVAMFRIRRALRER